MTIPTYPYPHPLAPREPKLKLVEASGETSCTGCYYNTPEQEIPFGPDSPGGVGCACKNPIKLLRDGCCPDNNFGLILVLDMEEKK